MAKLTLTYIEEEWTITPFPFMRLANIECEDMLEGLAILHERLNAVAMPRIHQEQIKSTAGTNYKDLVNGLQADDEFVTISC